MQFSRIFWDVSSGEELGQRTDLWLPFWPGSQRALLVEATNDVPWKLELYDVTTEKTLPLPFRQPWEKRVKLVRFSHDGKTLAVLDDNGKVWVEQVLTR